MEISAVHVNTSEHRNVTSVGFGSQALDVAGKSYLYSSLRFEIGGNNNSILFIHLKDSELIYIALDRGIKKQLLQIQIINAQLQLLFRVTTKTFYSDLSYIGLFLAIITSLVYFRAPIAGALSTLVPLNVEKKIGDKVFKNKDSDEFKKVVAAEEKLQKLLTRIKSFDRSKITVHISAKKEMNAYATIGGHLFINRGLIDELKKPEDLLGVIGHELVHVEKRHVIRTLFQGAGLFLLIQTLFGDVTGIAAVLADNGDTLLQLSYSRTLEKEADLLAVRMMLDSEINPTGLMSALKIMEEEHKKLLKDTAGGGTINKILNQNFLRSHPQTEQRCLDIQIEIDRLRKTSKYEQVEYVNLDSEWAEFKAAMSDL